MKYRRWWTLTKLLAGQIMAIVAFFVFLASCFVADNLTWLLFALGASLLGAAFLLQSLISAGEKRALNVAWRDSGGSDDES